MAAKHLNKEDISQINDYLMDSNEKIKITKNRKM